MYLSQSTHFILLSLIIGILLTSCSDNDNALFQMQVEADLTIPPGLNNLETHYFYLRDVPTLIRTQLAEGNQDQIDRVLATRATVTAPFNSVNFTIIQSMIIEAIDKADPANKKEIFYIENVPLDQERELRLFSSLSEVKDILLDDRMDLEIRTIFRTFTPTEIDARLTMNFNVYGQ